MKKEKIFIVLMLIFLMGFPWSLAAAGKGNYIRNILKISCGKYK